VTAENRKQLTVGRDAILRDTMDHLRSGIDRTSKHHFLFLGSRGIGKTHLLSLIEDGVGDDPRLTGRIVVARFPEESLGTLSFPDFLVRLVGVIADQLPTEKSWSMLRSSISIIADPSEVIDTVVPVIRKANAYQKRTILVLVENLSEMFSKQIRKDKDIGALRKFFMDKNGCQLIATASTYFDAVTDVSQPFYDFFDTQVLESLTKEQSVELLQRYVAVKGRADTIDCVELAPRLMSIHDLVEGNPRLISMACDCVVNDVIPSIRDTVESLLDQITPVYQSLLGSTAPQERALLEKLASMRDPKVSKTPGNIAEQMGLSQRQVSSLLTRLTENHILKNMVDPSDRRSRTYSIRDGFLDIWLAANVSRSLRERVLAVSECLESFYRRPSGPFDRTGRPSQLELVSWPLTNQLFSSASSSSRYLATIQTALDEWKNNRIGHFEVLAETLTSLGGVTEKNVCRALLLHEFDAPDENSLSQESKNAAQLRMAYLHFLLDEVADAERCLRSVLENCSSGDPFLSTALANLVYLLNVEKRHLEVRKLRSQYPGASLPTAEDASANTASSAIPERSSVYVSYAWGDNSPEGRNREQIVDLLCKTLRDRGVQVHRDKDHLTAGKSIAEFAKQISKSKRIIAVISDRYLRSRYCMVDELFQAYTRRNYDRLEFQEEIIQVVLDDASGTLSNPQKVAELAAFWHERANSLQDELVKSDPLAKASRSFVNQMQEMAERLPEMLSVLNDVVMKRGFDEIVNDSFAEILSLIPIQEASHASPPGQQDWTISQDLADQVGNAIAIQLEADCRAENEIEIQRLFHQGMSWIESGAEFATPAVKRRLLLWLSNALLHDQNDQRIKTHGLVDVSKLVDRANKEKAPPDIQLEALSVAISTHFQELTGDVPASLDALKSIDHPIALANRIRILLNRQFIDEAFDLVHHNPLDDRWAELAVVVYVRKDRMLDAEAICEKMRSNEPSADSRSSYLRYFRCLSCFAHELYGKAFANRNSGERLYPDRLLNEERKSLVHVLRILEPITSKVLGASRVENGVERAAVELAIGTSHLVGDTKQVDRLRIHTDSVPAEFKARLSEILATSRPISKYVIQSFRGGYLTPTKVIFDRLKVDWPEDIDVAISIVEAQSMMPSEIEDAIDALDRLSECDLTAEQNIQLSRAALQITIDSEPGLRDAAFGLLAKLAGAKHYYLKMVEAKWALDEKKFERALELLNERPASEDAHWLGLRASVLEQLGKLDEALADLQQLCQLTSAWHALRRAAEMAERLGRVDVAIELIERLVHFPEQRRFASQKLADTLYKSEGGDKTFRAAEIYECLYNESPDKPELAMNAVVCFVDLNELPRAFALLQEVTSSHPDFLRAFTTFAYLLMANNQTDQAFSLLNEEPIRNRFWTENKYLVLYMELGYRTSHELEAHAAMMQVRSLEDGINESNRTIREFDFDAVVEQLRDRREFMEKMNAQVVGGRTPWTLLPLKMGVPLQQAWAYRTQKLIPWESVAGRGQFSTYVSNGYCAETDVDGTRQLNPITAPERGTDIVADISALLTLHSLGLTEMVTTYFGTIYVPALYRGLELEDARRLQPHQRSQVDQSSRLYELLSRGELRRTETTSGGEYTVDAERDDKTNQCTVGDFVEWMFRQGLISHKIRDRAFNFGNLQSLEVSVLDNASTVEQFRFTSYALQTIESNGLLDHLLKSHKVYLTKEAVTEIEHDQFSMNQQARVARESRKFWQAMRDNDSFVFARVNKSLSDANDTDDSDLADKETSIGFDVCFSSLMLAKKRQLPLFSDDRVLHALMQNTGNVAPTSSSAFSTIELLSSLRSAKELDDDDFLTHVLRLIEWRYRFVLLDESVLLFAAKAFRANSHGLSGPLRRIAAYIQDTMIDVGLFGGNEQVDPPRSMAIDHFRHWTQVCARFVNRLWSDAAFSDADADLLTRWAIDNLLPTIGITIRPDLRMNLIQNQARLFLSHLLSQRGLNPDTSRSAQLMSVLRECLGMRDGEFWRSVFGLIEVDADGDGLDISPDNWKRAKEVHRRGVAKHALAQFHDDGGYQVDARGAALLEASRSLKRRIGGDVPPDSITEVMRDFQHERFVKSVPLGPLFFHREESKQSGGVFESTDLLIYPNADARSAVLEYFKILASGTQDVVSRRTIEALRVHRSKIVQQRAVNWYPAAEDLLAAIESDWQLNVAGFRQATIAQSQDWIQKYWVRCVRPESHPASTVPPEAFNACTDATTLKDRVFNELEAESDPNLLIEKYCQRVGHLPLDNEWSLSSLLERLAQKSGMEPIIDCVLNTAGINSPLHAYQGCRVLVDFWKKLSPEQRSRAGTCLSRFVVMSRGENLYTVEGRHWYLLHRLANHFLDWISLYGPEVGEDNSASLAWWLSERLTAVLVADIEGSNNPKERFEFLRERIVDPPCKSSSSAKQLVRGSATGTVFQLNTHLIRNGGPFFTSLIASMGEFLSDIVECLDADAKERIAEWLLVYAIHRPTGVTQPNSVLFRDHSAKIGRVLAAWKETISQEPDVDAAFSNLVEECEKLSEENFIDDILRRFDGYEEIERSNWLNRFRIAALNQKLALAPIQKMLRNQSERKNFVSALSSENVPLMIDLLLSTQHQAGDPWLHELPHLLVEWLDHVDSLETKAIVFNGILCSSAVGNCPSALRRVRERDDVSQLEPAFQFQLERIKSYRNNVPRWTWNRLRAYLELLIS